MGVIYKITNDINDKVYIGQTSKNRPTDRFSEHKYLARHEKLSDKRLVIDMAMAKYGVEHFKFIIIEDGIPDEMLDEREKYWISVFNSKQPNGYNITDGGSGTRGFARQQDADERHRKGESVKRFYEENPQQRIIASDNTKRLWEDESYRTKVTDSIRKYYSENPDMFLGENNPFYGKKHTSETIAAIKASKKDVSKTVLQLDKDTSEVIAQFDSLHDVQRILGFDRGYISKSANNGKVAYGYRWKFA